MADLAVLTMVINSGQAVTANQTLIDLSRNATLVQNSVNKTTNVFNTHEASIASVNAGYGSLIGTLTKLVSIYSVYQTLVDTLKAGAGVQQSIVAFTTLTGSQQKAIDLVGQLQQLAAKSPFNVSAINEAATTYLALGGNAADAVRDVTTLTNTVASFGGTEGDINNIALAFGKIREQGELTGQSIRTLNANKIDVLGILGNSLGQDRQQVRYLIEHNLIDVNSAIEDILQNLNEKYGQGLTNLSKTSSGAFGVLLSNIRNVQANIGAQIEYLPGLAEFINSLIPRVQAFGQTIIEAIRILAGLPPQIEALQGPAHTLIDLTEIFGLIIAGIVAIKLAGTLGEWADSFYALVTAEKSATAASLGFASTLQIAVLAGGAFLAIGTALVKNFESIGFAADATIGTLSKLTATLDKKGFESASFLAPDRTSTAFKPEQFDSVAKQIDLSQSLKLSPSDRTQLDTIHSEILSAFQLGSNVDVDQLSQQVGRVVTDLSTNADPAIKDLAIRIGSAFTGPLVDAFNNQKVANALGGATGGLSKSLLDNLGGIREDVADAGIGLRDSLVDQQRTADYAKDGRLQAQSIIETFTNGAAQLLGSFGGGSALGKALENLGATANKNITDLINKSKTLNQAYQTQTSADLLNIGPLKQTTDLMADLKKKIIEGNETNNDLAIGQNVDAGTKQLAALSAKISDLHDQANVQLGTLFKPLEAAAKSGDADYVANFLGTAYDKAKDLAGDEGQAIIDKLIDSVQTSLSPGKVAGTVPLIEAAVKQLTDASLKQVTDLRDQLAKVEANKPLSQIQGQLADQKNAFGEGATLQTQFGLSDDQSAFLTKAHDQITAAYVDAPDEGIKKIQELDAALQKLNTGDKLIKIADGIGDAFSSSLTDVVFQAKSAKEALEDLFQSVEKLIFQQTVAQPLSNAISGGIKSFEGGFSSLFSNAAAGTGTAAAAAVASAKGNVFMRGNVVPFAFGGVPDMVSSPTYFPMRGGKTGLVGEAGPEAIVPLARDGSGRLGIRGGSGSSVTNVTNQYISTPDAQSFRKSQSQNLRKARKGLTRG